MRPLLALALIACAYGHNETMLLPPKGISAFRLTGAPLGQASEVKVEDQFFTEALRLQTITTPPNLHGEGQRALRMRAAPADAVQKNDTIIATFWMRCIQSTAPVCGTTFNVEKATEPFTKSAHFYVTAGKEWKRVDLVFRMAEEYAKDGYSIEFWMGYEPQTFELGAVYVENFHDELPELSQLGGLVRYDGWEPNADWRTEADARIDRYRKADLKVRAIDAAGNALKGASVKLRMTRHRFVFGTSVSSDGLLDNSTDGEQYRKIIREWFNGAVLENELKWPNWEGDRTKALAAVDWLQASGISKLRGHNLIWPNWNLMPPDVQKLSADARSMRNRVNDHIADEVAANRGRLTDWDVLNEPYSNRDVQGVLGNGEMAEWFKQERRLDPDAALYVNDYGILEGNGADIVRQNGYFNIIQNILENGGPIDGIGLQGHFNYQFTGPVRMLEILDRFAKLGPSIKVTEFDVDVADETLQAEFTRDFLTAMFSHPAVNGIFVWGFWEARQAPERRYVPARLVKETQC